MAITEQILPTINNLACGPVGVRMYYDDSITGFTFPTEVSFLDIGEFKESIDLEAGVTDLDNVDVTVREDYSTHADGFWYKLLKDNPDVDIELMFTIFEGANETFLFRGNLYRENIKVPEYYLDKLDTTPTAWVRGMEFKLVSSVNVLKNVNIGDLCAEVFSHKILKGVSGGVTTFYFATFMNVFACMVQLAYGVSYDETLAVINSTDIQVYDSVNSAWVSPINSNVYLHADYFLSPSLANGAYIPRCSNAYDLLKLICGQFGLIPRYSFGTTAELIDGTPANNKQRLIFESRGRSGASVTMDGKILESSKILDTPRKSRRIRSAHTFTASDGVHFVNDVENYGEPASWLEFDIVKQVDFEMSQTSSFSYAKLYNFDSGADTMVPITKCRYWNYSTGAYVERIQAGQFGLAAALGEYLFYKYRNGRHQYERTYSSLAADDGSIDSQRTLRTLVQTTISDGTDSADYYATEVTKDIKKNQAKVVWVQL